MRFRSIAVLAAYLGLSATLAVGQEEMPFNEARISGVGVVDMVIDRSAGAEERCAAYERPFMATVRQDSLDFGRSRFGETFGSVPQVPQGPIVVRRGVESVEEQRFGHNIIQAQPRSIVFTTPEFTANLDLSIYGCVRMGHMRVTEFLARLDGEVAEYRMGLEASRAAATGNRALFELVSRSFPRRHPSGEGYAIDGERFDDVFGFPYEDHYLGVFNLYVSSHDHTFPALLEGRQGIVGEFTLSMTLLIVDAGLSAP